ncbi:MAG: cytochrome C oxidase subunit IV family protein [Blastocatellales bacterium]
MADHSHDHPANPLPYYFGVFTLLLVMTGLTVFVAKFDLEHIWPPLNIIVAMTIAVIKATAVIMIFMHVRWSSRLTQLIVVSGIFWLIIMLAFTVSDYYTRGGWPTALGQ